VSLSQEIGYQRRDFSPDTWTWEIRPIVDKKIGCWKLSFNPALDRSFHGESVHRGVEFSPNAKVSYDFTKWIYYAAYGPITGFDPLRDQQQQFFPTIDLDLGPALGVQLWRGCGYDRLHRSPDHQVHCWAALFVDAPKSEFNPLIRGRRTGRSCEAASSDCAKSTSNPKHSGTHHV
jgi:hypothetical protein